MQAAAVRWALLQCGTDGWVGWVRVATTICVALEADVLDAASTSTSPREAVLSSLRLPPHVGALTAANLSSACDRISRGAAGGALLVASASLRQALPSVETDLPGWDPAAPIADVYAQAIAAAVECAAADGVEGSAPPSGDALSRNPCAAALRALRIRSVAQAVVGSTTECTLSTSTVAAQVPVLTPAALSRPRLRGGAGVGLYECQVAVALMRGEVPPSPRAPTPPPQPPSPLAPPTPAAAIRVDFARTASGATDAAQPMDVAVAPAAEPPAGVPASTDALAIAAAAARIEAAVDGAEAAPAPASVAAGEIAPSNEAEVSASTSAAAVEETAAAAGAGASATAAAVSAEPVGVSADGGGGDDDDDVGALLPASPEGAQLMTGRRSTASRAAFGASPPPPPAPPALTGALLQHDTTEGQVEEAAAAATAEPGAAPSTETEPAPPPPSSSLAATEYAPDAIPDMQILADARAAVAGMLSVLAAATAAATASAARTATAASAAGGDGESRPTPVRDIGPLATAGALAVAAPRTQSAAPATPSATAPSASPAPSDAAAPDDAAAPLESAPSAMRRPAAAPSSTQGTSTSLGVPGAASAFTATSPLSAAILARYGITLPSSGLRGSTASPAVAGATSFESVFPPETSGLPLRQLAGAARPPPSASRTSSSSTDGGGALQLGGPARPFALVPSLLQRLAVPGPGLDAEAEAVVRVLRDASAAAAGVPTRPERAPARGGGGDAELPALDHRGGAAAAGDAWGAAWGDAGGLTSTATATPRRRYDGALPSAATATPGSVLAATRSLLSDSLDSMLARVNALGTEPYPQPQQHTQPQYGGSATTPLRGTTALTASAAYRSTPESRAGPAEFSLASTATLPLAPPREIEPPPAATARPSALLAAVEQLYTSTSTSTTALRYPSGGPMPAPLSAAASLGGPPPLGHTMLLGGQSLAPAASSIAPVWEGSSYLSPYHMLSPMRGGGLSLDARSATAYDGGPSWGDVAATSDGALSAVMDMLTRKSRPMPPPPPPPAPEPVLEFDMATHAIADGDAADAGAPDAAYSHAYGTDSYGVDNYGDAAGGTIPPPPPPPPPRTRPSQHQSADAYIAHADSSAYHAASSSRDVAASVVPSSAHAAYLALQPAPATAAAVYQPIPAATTTGGAVDEGDDDILDAELSMDPSAWVARLDAEAAAAAAELRT